MGSITRVRVSYTDLTVFLGSLPAGIPVYGTLLEAPDITTYQFTKPGIIIIGNESNGISAPVLPFIKHPVRIPTFLSPGNGLTTAESLNASVANAIICYEIRKQLFTKNS
jgi:TrmH family RNA methyltransferase